MVGGINTSMAALISGIQRSTATYLKIMLFGALEFQHTDMSDEGLDMDIRRITGKVGAGKAVW